jgi:hypothetical protein
MFQLTMVKMKICENHYFPLQDTVDMCYDCELYVPTLIFRFDTVNINPDHLRTTCHDSKNEKTQT